jgi:hypothetical protein
MILSLALLTRASSIEELFMHDESSDSDDFKPKYVDFATLSLLTGEPSIDEAYYRQHDLQDGVGFNPRYVDHPTLALLTSEPDIEESFCQDSPPGTAGSKIKYVDSEDTFRETAYSPGSFLATLGQMFGVCNTWETPRLGFVVDTTSLLYTSLDALYQTQNLFDYMSDSVRTESDVADDVSDTSNEDEDDLSTSLPTKLHYYHADTEQSIAYTTFNQLFMNSDSEDIMLGVHRDDNDFELVDGVLEIGELPSGGDAKGFGLPSQEESDFEGFDFDLGEPTLAPARPARLRSIKGLSSYSSVPRKFSRRHRRLTASTQLDAILETPSSEDEAPLSPTSSDGMMDFSDRRGFAQPLQTRRTDFLDDEDSDVNPEVPQYADSSDSFDREPADSTLMLPVIDHVAEDSENNDLYDDDPVGEFEPELSLVSPTLPVEPPMASAADPNFDTRSTADYDHDTGIIEGMETETMQLIAYIFACLNDGRLTELPALVCDLQWALSYLADTFPRRAGFTLLKRLGTTVEVLLELVVTPGN